MVLFTVLALADVVAAAVVVVAMIGNQSVSISTTFADWDPDPELILESAEIPELDWEEVTDPNTAPDTSPDIDPDPDTDPDPDPKTDADIDIDLDIDPDPGPDTDDNALSASLISKDVNKYNAHP